MKKITLIFTLLMLSAFSWQSNAQLSYDNACTVTFEDISTTGVVIMEDDGTTPLGDDGEGNITLPFAFSLDGVSSTDLRVGNNGGVLFNVTTGNVSTGSSPTVQGFYPFIDDLDSDQGSVVWEALGTAPNRRVVIMWNDRNHFAFPTSVGGITFEMILHETSNEITYLYQDTEFGVGNTDNDAVSAGILIVGANGVYTYSTDTALAGVTCINWVIPTCLPASALAVSNETTTTADLAWTDNNSLAVTDYEYVVQAVGTGTPTVSGTPTTANPQPLSGLTASTLYEVYIRAICSTTDSSDWTKVDFGTLCEAFGDFTENFEATVDGELTLCWSSIVNSSATNASVTVEEDGFTTTSNSPANKLELYNGNDPNSQLLLITPELTDLEANTHRIRFMAYGDQTEPALVVGTMTDPTDISTFHPSGGVTLTDTYTEYSVVFGNVPVGDKYVALMHGNDGSTDTDFQTIRIDDFTWEPTPSCIEPIDILVSAETLTGATIVWTDVNATTPSAWDLYIVPAGDAAPDAASTPTTGLNDVSTQTTTWTGGTDNTSYDVYVRADCGANNTDVSAWTGPINFSTLCTAFSVPFNETFNSDSASQNCWTVRDENADGDEWDLDYTTNPFEGDEVAAIYTDYNAGANDDYLISPAITLTGNERLKFQYRVQSNGEPNNYELLLSTTGNTATDFTNTLITTTSYSNTTYVEEIVDLSAYTGNVYIAWHIPVSSLDGWRLYIDDVTVEEKPSCYKPTDLAVTAITAAGATFSWIDNVNNTTAATTWDLYIVPTGDAAPDAVSMPTSGLNDVTDATATIWTAGIANTKYDVYVRADCDSDNTGVSAWTGPVGFQTECDALTAPFTENFENAGVLPGCWRMNGGEDWNFSNSASGNHIGNNGTLTGNTTSDGYFAWVDSSSGPETVAPLLTSPMVDVSALTTPALYFYLNSNKEGAANSTLNVEVYDGAAWNAVATYNSDTNGWEEKIIVLNGLTITGNVKVRFEFIDTIGSSNFTDDIAIDDVSFREAPTCFKPTDLTVANIDDVAGTADFVWTDAYGTPPANGWEYEIVDITAAGVPTGTGVATTTNPVSVSSLVAGNQYEFLVRAMCGASDESEWSTAFAWTQMNVPDCASNPVIADTTIDVPVGVNTFTWDVPATGTVASYDVYGGLTAALEIGLIGNTTTATFDMNLSEYATTYYWQVVPKNAGGMASGCSVWSFTTVDAPANDLCADSVALTIGSTFAENEITGMTGNTDSGELAPGCASYNGRDVWYSVVVPTDGVVNLEVDAVTGSSVTDTGAAAYSGTCGALTLINCDDDGGNGAFSKVAVNDIALAGQTIYFRVWEYGGNSYGEFKVSAWNPNTASVNDLTSVGFNYYPNPVSNELTMTANENITSVSIFNMLGQEVRTITPSSLEVSVDMTNLTSGTYFVKAQVGTSVGTFKIVKK